MTHQYSHHVGRDPEDLGACSSMWLNACKEMELSYFSWKIYKGNVPSLGIHFGEPRPCGQRTPSKPTRQTLWQPRKRGWKGRGKMGCAGPLSPPARRALRPQGTASRPKTEAGPRGSMWRLSLHAPGRRSRPASLKRQTPAGPRPQSGCSHHPPRSHAGAQAAHSL